VHLIVDGLSESLVFSDEATIDAEEGEQFVWYQQEIEDAWLGHRAYIQIVDDDDGFVAVDRIVLSDNPVPPPDVPGDLLIDLVDDPLMNSPQSLTRSVEQLFSRTIALWVSGAWDRTEGSADLVSILNWLWNRGLIDHPPAPGSLADSEQALKGQLEVVQALEAEIATPQLALVTTDGTPHDEFLLVRGDHLRPEAEVGRRPPRFLAGPSVGKGKPAAPGERDAAVGPTEGSGRRELADWVADRENPLFSRVMVNRLWQHHFGRGLVGTPDDFGTMGEPPTHPALLDYLADEFVRSGFSLKLLHRQMVLSSAYRMSSDPGDAATEAADPDNRLLHRMPLRRLEAEAIRDAILLISGRLDTQMEGRGIAPHLTPFMDGRGRPETSGPLDGDRRRSIYLTVRRNFLTPMMSVFDFPTPDAPRGVRASTNVPAQALALANNELVQQQARHWAANLLRRTPASDDERLRPLYENAYGRPPTAEEVDAAMTFLKHSRGSSSDASEEQIWSDLCHVLLNGPEFIFLR
jgi:hypothetical protein